MREARPGKILVIFRPEIAPAEDYVYLMNTPRPKQPKRHEPPPPWAAEVSAIPREGSVITYYDASVKKHPERWTAVIEGQTRWSLERSIWKVGNVEMYVPDLNVYVIPVYLQHRRSDRSRDRHHRRLAAVAEALDLPPPRRRLSTKENSHEE